MRVLVTGATGFLGGHVLEQLRAAGDTPVALARAGSAVSRGAPVSVVTGDLRDPVSLRRACEGMDAVIHCAGHVAAAGPWSVFEQAIVGGTRNIAEAAARAGVGTFVHVSSVAAYGVRSRRDALAETSPLERSSARWNHYVRAKVAAEDAVSAAGASGKMRVTSVRPSAILGPGDRNGLPRLVTAIRSRAAVILGNGANRVPFVVVEDVARAIARAVHSETARGRAYNLSGADAITQREFLSLCARCAGVDPPRRHVPRSVAYAMGIAAEWGYRLARRADEPPVSRFGVLVASSDITVDCSAARTDLGWVGASSYADAVRRWFDASGQRRAPGRE